jgi:hypothetical protein
VWTNRHSRFGIGDPEIFRPSAIVGSGASFRNPVLDRWWRGAARDAGCPTASDANAVLAEEILSAACFLIFQAVRPIFVQRKSVRRTQSPI